MLSNKIIATSLHYTQRTTVSRLSTTAMRRLADDPSSKKSGVGSAEKANREIVEDLKYANTLTSCKLPAQSILLERSATENSIVPDISGIPEEHQQARQARIFQPARNAMQSGWSKTNHWMIELDTQQRWENMNIGWSSNADPLSNISMALSFASKEDAVQFCEKNKWTYEVLEKQERALRPKAYGSNFSWNKRTRVSTNANSNMNHAMNGNGTALQPSETATSSSSTTIQNLLMENGRLIETIAGLQRIQKHSDVPKYMELLYRNIVHLAKLGDPEALSQLQLETGLIGAVGQPPAPVAQPSHSNTTVGVQPTSSTFTATNPTPQPVNDYPMQTAQRVAGAPPYGMTPTVPLPPPHSMPGGQPPPYFAPQPLHPMHHPYGMPPVGLPAPGQPPHHLPPPHGDPATAAAAMYHHQQAQAQHLQMAPHPYGLPPQVPIYTSVANVPDPSSTQAAL